jgi:hypothetical protein
MKHFILVTIISLLSISVANAQDRDPVFFESITARDVLSGVGLYIKDVGHKTVQGTKKVLKGTGEIISSPFKARLSWPKPRLFRYERGFWVPPKLDELPTMPPKVELGEPLEPRPLIYPLHREIDNQEFITLAEFTF